MLKIANIDFNSRIYSINTNDTSVAIWTQGCTLNCKGCWNKHLHPFEGGTEYGVDKLINLISEVKDKVKNVTILGGEPLQQDIKSLKEFLTKVRNDLELTTVLYTGYEKEDLANNEELKDIYDYTDVLIVGRYKHELRNIKNHLIGSENQEIIFCTDKYSEKDIINRTCVEITIDKNNNTISTYGYPDDFFGVI